MLLELVMHSILSGCHTSWLFALRLSRYCFNEHHLGGVSYQRAVEHPELTDIGRRDDNCGTQWGSGLGREWSGKFHANLRSLQARRLKAEKVVIKCLGFNSN